MCCYSVCLQLYVNAAAILENPDYEVLHRVYRRVFDCKSLVPNENSLVEETRILLALNMIVLL